MGTRANRHDEKTYYVCMYVIYILHYSQNFSSTGNKGVRLTDARGQCRLMYEDKLISIM